MAITSPPKHDVVELMNGSGRIEPVIWIPAEGVIRSSVAHEKMCAVLSAKKISCVGSAGWVIHLCDLRFGEAAVNIVKYPSVLLVQRVSVVGVDIKSLVQPSFARS